ncbi:MAG: sporulation transcriptional regulator SpoIIID [Firmicutes bacterium]|nr:sporulation transcriptional regulator SpoIIID [Bacillota bacterium]MCL1953268.1 sporulation transcriptional regulator SpoIIID [Bacillota bacterium]
MQKNFKKNTILDTNCKSHIAVRSVQLAHYICQHNTTVRETAIVFDISKSTVHKDISQRLKHIDLELYKKVKKIIDKNLAERHLRGGQATKNRYLTQSRKTKN